jgi:phage shock protein A
MPVSDKDAIQKLGETEEVFLKKLAHLEARQRRLTEEAKQHLKQGNRQTAKACLKQRAQLVQSADAIQKHRTTVSALKLQLEQSLLMQTVVQGIKHGHQALSRIHQDVDINAVNTLLDGIQEHVEHSNEVLHTLEQAGSDLEAANNGGVAFDEEELERELAALGTATDVLRPPPSQVDAIMPAVPTHEPITEEDEIFINLIRSMEERPLVSG